MSISELKEQGNVGRVLFTSNGEFRVLFNSSVLSKMPKIVNVCEATKGMNAILDFDNLRIISADNEEISYPMCGVVSDETYGRWVTVSISDLEKYNVVKVILPYCDVSSNKLLNNPGIKTCKRFLYEHDKIEVVYQQTAENKFKDASANNILLEYLKIFAANNFISSIKIVTPLLENAAVVKENYPDGIQIVYDTDSPEEAQKIFTEVCEELRVTLEIILPDESKGLPVITGEVITDV